MVKAYSVAFSALIAVVCLNSLVLGQIPARPQYNLKPLTRLDTGGETVSEIAFTSGGSRLIIGSGTGTSGRIQVWDTQNWQVIRTIEAHDRYLEAMSVFPDGKRVVSCGGNEDVIRIWSLETGELQRTLRGYKGMTVRLAISPDGKVIAAVGFDPLIPLWNSETGELLRQMKGHDDVVQCLAFSPDGTRLFSGSVNGAIHAWDVQTGNSIWSDTSEPRGVLQVAIYPDGKEVMTTRCCTTVQFRSAETGVLRDRQLVEEGACKVEYLPNGKEVAIATREEIRLRSLENLALLGSLRAVPWYEEFVRGGGARLASLAISPDSQFLAAGMRTGGVLVFSIIR